MQACGRKAGHRVLRLMHGALAQEGWRLGRKTPQAWESAPHSWSPAWHFPTVK